MSQSHFTLRFPLKSPVDAKAMAQELSPLMPALFQAEDAIGSVHYSRFTVLSHKTLFFLADFDGGFGELIRSLAGHAGRVFDTISEHVADPPPTPVSDHVDAFAEWAADHLSNCSGAYRGPLRSASIKAQGMPTACLSLRQRCRSACCPISSKRHGASGATSRMSRPP